MTPAYQDFLQKRDALEREILRTRPCSREKRRGAGDAQEKKDLRKEVIEARRKIARLESTDPGSPAAAPRSCRTAPNRTIRRSSSAAKRKTRARSSRGNFWRSFRPPTRALPQRQRAPGTGQLHSQPRQPPDPRVLVNRVWLHHFGEGIVTTPDDFGNQSDPPSHPELLDYLATRFMPEGWSIKKLHRLIMLSNAYQESSENNPALRADRSPEPPAVARQHPAPGI